MNILLAGGTGLIGSALVNELKKFDNQIYVLTRDPEGYQKHSNIQYEFWDGKTLGEWFPLIENVDCVINLTGESIGNKRWSKKQKDKIIRSRVDSGKVLTLAISKAEEKPQVFIQASAIGYYGTSIKKIFNEKSPPGDDFLSEVCTNWESSSQLIESLGVKRLIVRIGVVLSRSGGALKRLLIPFHMRVGGPLGTGKQVISWIHLYDVVKGMKKLIDTPELEGVFNFVAPNPVINEEIGKVISGISKTPYWMPVPSAVLKLVLGEMSTLVLDGQYVIPDRLLKANYQFEFSTIEDALTNLWKR